MSLSELETYKAVTAVTAQPCGCGYWTNDSWVHPADSCPTVLTSEESTYSRAHARRENGPSNSSTPPHAQLRFGKKINFLMRSN